MVQECVFPTSIACQEIKLWKFFRTSFRKRLTVKLCDLVHHKYHNYKSMFCNNTYQAPFRVTGISVNIACTKKVLFQKFQSNHMIYDIIMMSS